MTHCIARLDEPNSPATSPHEHPSIPSADWIPRHLTHNVQESLLDTRVVLVNGPRQCGKPPWYASSGATCATSRWTTPTWPLFAQQDPVGLIRQLDRAIIDEVQRAPQLMPLAKKWPSMKTSAQVVSPADRVRQRTGLAANGRQLGGAHGSTPAAPVAGRTATAPQRLLQRARQQDWPITHADWAIPPLLAKPTWWSMHSQAATWKCGLRATSASASPGVPLHHHPGGARRARHRTH